jgi:hypothetical protein
MNASSPIWDCRLPIGTPTRTSLGFKVRIGNRQLAIGNQPHPAL